ncbi:MAG: squalene synthase HpnD [Planctomycetota bacterium]|nr:MAG: squalene synthase HpnD [Planctomycetota bacterium]
MATSAAATARSMQPPGSPAAPPGRRGLHAAYAHCAAVARRAAKNFYYAFLLLPPPQRRAMYALYAFCRAADDVVDEPGSPADKRKGLERLRAQLERCWRQGVPPAGPPAAPTPPAADPIFVALADVRRRCGLERRHLEEVLEGCAMDLERERYETWVALCVYLDRVATAVGRATMQVLGLDPERLAEYALAGGRAVQLTNIIRDVREDAERGRVYLPQEDLRRFGVAPEQLRGSGPPGPRLRALLAFEVERARALYRRARELTSPAERRRLLPLTAICRIYERVLDEIERRGHDVFGARVSIPAWHKGWLGLETWLRARLGLHIPR